jgi:uridine monophosphate synthetase
MFLWIWSSSMEKRLLVQKLYDKGVIRIGTATLKSGIVTPVQIELQQVIAFPQLLQTVAQMIWNKIRHLTDNIDLLCGIPESTLPIIKQLSLQVNKRTLIVRKGNKSYSKKWVEGPYRLGESCLLFEEAITTGASAINTINHVKKAGLYVPYVLTFLDREHGGRAALTKTGCELHSIFTQTELLAELRECGIELPDTTEI